MRVRNRSLYDQEEDGPCDPNAPVYIRHEPESHIQVRAEVNTQDEVLPVAAPPVALPEDDIWGIIQRHIDNHGFDDGDDEEETVDTEENDEDEESHVTEYTVNSHNTESSASSESTLIIPFDADDNESESEEENESVESVNDADGSDIDSVVSAPIDVNPEVPDPLPDQDVNVVDPPQGGDLPADGPAEEPADGHNEGEEGQVVITAPIDRWIVGQIQRTRNGVSEYEEVRTLERIHIVEIFTAVNLNRHSVFNLFDLAWQYLLDVFLGARTPVIQGSILELRSNHSRLPSRLMRFFGFHGKARERTDEHMAFAGRYNAHFEGQIFEELLNRLLQMTGSKNPHDHGGNFSRTLLAHLRTVAVGLNPGYFALANRDLTAYTLMYAINQCVGMDSVVSLAVPAGVVNKNVDNDPFKRGAGAAGGTNSLNF